MSPSNSWFCPRAGPGSRADADTDLCWGWAVPSARGREGGVELGLACAPREMLQCVNSSSETPQGKQQQQGLYTEVLVLCTRKDAQGWIWDSLNHSEMQSVQQLSGAKGVLETSTICRDCSKHGADSGKGTRYVQNQVNVLRMSTEPSVLSPGNFTPFFSCFHKLSLLLEAAGIRKKKGISSCNS